MFDDLDWPLNASRGLSSIAEFLVYSIIKTKDNLQLFTPWQLSMSCYSALFKYFDTRRLATANIAHEHSCRSGRGRPCKNFHMISMQTLMLLVIPCGHYVKGLKISGTGTPVLLRGVIYDHPPPRNTPFFYVCCCVKFGRSNQIKSNLYFLSQTVRLYLQRSVVKNWPLASCFSMSLRVIGTNTGSKFAKLSTAVHLTLTLKGSPHNSVMAK